MWTLSSACKTDQTDFRDWITFLPSNLFFFFKLGFTPYQAEQPLQGMELQEKETQRDSGIQEICLERNYS